MRPDTMLAPPEALPVFAEFRLVFGDFQHP